MLVSLSIIIECLGISKMQIGRLAQGGIIPKSIKGEYDLVPSVRGYVESLRSRTDPASISLTQEKALLAMRQRERLELELAERREELISVELVERTWQKIISISRAKLLVIPTKLAPLVFTSKTIPEIKEVIKDAIYEALKELAETGSEDTGLDPTANSKRKRVGGRKETTQS